MLVQVVGGKVVDRGEGIGHGDNRVSDGQRLSKRNADAGLDTLGERYTAPEILGKLAYLAGFNPSAEPRSGDRP